MDETSFKILMTMKAIWCWNTLKWTVLVLFSTMILGWTGKHGSRPPPWVPLVKSNGSSILSTSLGSKTLNLGSKTLKTPSLGIFFSILA